MILTAIQQISIKTSDCLYKKFEDLWAIIERCISSLLNQKPDNISNARPLLNKLSPVVIETFKCIFTFENAKKYEVIQNTSVQTSVYRIIKTVKIMLTY